MARLAPFFVAAGAFALSAALAYAQTSQPAPPSASSSAASAPAAQSTLREALQAARARNLTRARELQAGLSDPTARRIVDWALADIFGAQLGEAELHRLSALLLQWPRADARRQAIAAQLPKGPIPYTALGSSPASGGGSFTQRRRRMNEALRVGDASGAYHAIAAHGLAPGGVDYAEAESFAGWLALNKLKNPALALQHFTRLDAAVTSPVSKARAAYWQGLAAEALGQRDRAKAFFEAGAQHNTTFYGQLAAERAGHREIVLTPDPTPSAAERAAFEEKELVRALTLLGAAGERELVRVFALHMGERVESRAELALLVDKLKAMGEQEVSLLAYRRGAQKGFILHERGYPLRTPPAGARDVEPALVLAIVRQESQFDPRVRSSADARGMMQLLPGTGREVARKIGLAWDESLLWDPDQNMRLGTAYLGQLVDRFSGSYVLATAGYNAGPGRPAQWVQFCSDPRASGSDPIDFLECIPFNETRTYVSNVMSNLQVYRARLNGGRAPLTLSRDLRRGAWSTTAAAASATSGAP